MNDNNVIRLHPMTETATPYLSWREVMELLHIRSRVTLYRYEAEGLPFHQVRKGGPKLYDREQVQAWVNSRCSAPTPGEACA